MAKRALEEDQVLAESSVRKRNGSSQEPDDALGIGGSHEKEVAFAQHSSRGGSREPENTLYDVNLHGSPRTKPRTSEDVRALRVQLDALRSDLERALSDKQVLELELAKGAKYRKAFEAREAVVLEQAAQIAELSAALDKLKKETGAEQIARLAEVQQQKDALAAQNEALSTKLDDTLRQLEGAMQKRLSAEKEAAQHRVEATRLRGNAELREHGLSPLDAVVAQTNVEQQDAEPAREADKARAPLVCTLTGFPDERSAELIAAIEGLGGTVRMKEPFDKLTTHVVRPNDDTVRLKVLAGQLLHAWIVSAEWIKASVEAGKFVDESPFGYKLSSGTTRRVAAMGLGACSTLRADFNPIRGTTFYIHKDVDETKRKNARNKALLIELGGGILRMGPSAANRVRDYRIVNRDSERKKGDIYWSDFLALISKDGAKHPQ